jgi:Flp pilus assembly protein TadD
MTFPRKRGPVYFLLLAALSGCAVVPQAVLHPDPLSADEHVHLGVAYETQTQLANAAQQYRLALNLDPRNVQALMSLGGLEFNAGHLPAAERCYARALKVNPHDATVSNNLAMVYLAREKHLDKMDRLLADALKQPGELRPYVLETQAKWEAHQGHAARAQEILKEAQTLAPPQNKALRDELTQSREALTK